MIQSKATKYYWKGQIYSVLPPLISANNSAFLYGESLTTTFLVRQNKVLNLKDHFDRLLDAAKFFYDEHDVLSWNYFLNALSKICGPKSQSIKNGRVKAMLFFSPAQLPSQGHLHREWNFLLQMDELADDYSTKKVWNPVKVKSMERQVYSSIGKFGSYGREFALRRKWQREWGVDDILWKNSKGNPLELTTSAVVMYSHAEDQWHFPLNEEIVVESLMAKNFKLFLESKNFFITSSKCENAAMILLTMNSAEIFQWVSEIDAVSIAISSQIKEKLNHLLVEFINFNWTKLSETICL
ncbi:MAG: aminotransferase class IV [Bacteriovoracaceae bacterium]|nr:aminotransferase class IV [Bacteriovoracaceae bacterium]